jgi:ornithine decarboxylase
VREGDYIEIGNIGAYGRALATRFNGYGAYHNVILQDEPIYSIYLEEKTKIATSGR